MRQYVLCQNIFSLSGRNLKMTVRQCVRCLLCLYWEITERKKIILTTVMKNNERN